MDITQEMLTTFNGGPDLLTKVVTSDESWVSMTLKLKLSHSNESVEEPRPKKAGQVRANVKVLLTVFFDCNGVMYGQ